MAELASRRVQVAVREGDSSYYQCYCSTRAQRRSHSVSAPRFSEIKLDQTGIQWRQRLNFTVPSLCCTVGTTLAKKKNHPWRREERCSILWYYARWRTISAGQSHPRLSATFALRWPCVIEHDITRWNSVLLAANLKDGSFFWPG